VDTSTLDLATKEHGREALAAVGIPLLDCPVSGIASQAAAGDAVIYASGADDVLDQCEEVLRLISRTVFRVGDFGVGSKTKLLANMLVGIHNTAAAEMLGAATRAGLDPEPTLSAIAAGAGGSRMLDARGPMMISGVYGDHATVETFRKDLRLIRSFMTEIGARTPLLDVVFSLYDEVAEAGSAQVDPAVVYAAYTKGVGSPDG
jgi:3-hydroxyisobutyrate dehydrogenase-like beta-hydroxyacid dehydrogenase